MRIVLISFRLEAGIALLPHLSALGAIPGGLLG